MISSTTRGAVMIMLSAIFFGMMPFFALKTYAEGFDVNNLLLFRYIFAFILIALFCLYKKISLRINRKQFIHLLMAAIVGTMMTTYTLFKSYQYISSGLASTLHFIYPIVTLILATVLFKERFTVYKLMALLLSLSGIAILATGTREPLNTTGILWALASGILYAIYITSMAHPELKKLNSFTASFWIFGITGFLFLIQGMATNNINLEITPKALFYMLNLSIWSTFGAVVLFFNGLKQTGPGNASLLSTLEPLTGVVIGVIVFHESLDLKTLIAMLLILGSVLVVVQHKDSSKEILTAKSPEGSTPIRLKRHYLLPAISMFIKSQRKQGL
ncbi:EamA family transporter [Maribellus sp. CM-23]|uniref:DMT family transporter n=1 Tax=Maribellus sp. CM-23 TaxID=2781026 RepID=UPI001F279989|nr:DMT family transporter [Maribellus sp. CM-23]MCE4564253.1 EamA family transporter [Maribellus sp. CM-23]